MKLFSLNSGLALAALALVTLTFSSCKKDEPSADFTFTADDLDVTFTFTGEGDIDTYSWDFGDGSASSSENPTHTYSSAGTYTVTLMVSNDDGEDETSKSVEVTLSAPEPPAPKFDGANGALIAINSQSTTEQAGFEIDINIGTAVAWFGDVDNYESAGTVSWSQGDEGETLTRNNNNTYTWVEQDMNLTGFDENDPITWDVTGGGNTPAFDYTYNRGFPEMNGIWSETTIDGSESYTLWHDGSISNSDSVYYVISGSGGSVTKRMGGNASGATFSAEEIESIGSGTAIFQIAAINYTRLEFDGRLIYFINETVVSETGEIE